MNTFVKGNFVVDITLREGDKYRYGVVEYVAHNYKVYCRWACTEINLKSKNYSSDSILWSYIHNLRLLGKKKIEVYGIVKFLASIEKEKVK